MDGSLLLHCEGPFYGPHFIATSSLPIMENNDDDRQKRTTNVIKHPLPYNQPLQQDCPLDKTHIQWIGGKEEESRWDII